MTQFIDPTNLTLKLNTGADMPMIALGGYAGTTPEEISRAEAWMSTGLEAGYKHMDTAWLYGTEKALGDAMRKSGIPREGMFVTTKLPWNAYNGRVKEVFEESLASLDVGYVDLYLMHWPFPILYEKGNNMPTHEDGTAILAEGPGTTFNEVYAEIEALYAAEVGALNVDAESEALKVDAGASGPRVRAIGVSNFSVKNLELLLKTAKIVPAVNQFEVQPYSNQDELIAYCRSKGIAVMAFTPSGRDEVRKDPLLHALASKYGVSVNQVILGWHIARGVGIVPGSRDAGRQRDNLRLPVLSEEDVKSITALNRDEMQANKPMEVKGKVFGATYEMLGFPAPK